jgi:hypothetical protein
MPFWAFRIDANYHLHSNFTTRELQVYPYPFSKLQLDDELGLELTSCEFGMQMIFGMMRIAQRHVVTV